MLPLTSASRLASGVGAQPPEAVIGTQELELTGGAAPPSLTLEVKAGSVASYGVGSPGRLRLLPARARERGRRTITVFAALLLCLLLSGPGPFLFSSSAFAPGAPGGPSIGCSILMFAALWVPPGVRGAFVLCFFEFFLRSGRPGGPSVRWSILRFPRMGPAPGCSVVLIFGFWGAPRLARSPPHAPGPLRRLGPTPFF